MIEAVKIQDLKEINSLIVKEFPYTKMTVEMLAARMDSSEKSLFKSVSGRKLTGFIEVEQLSETRGRVNGVTVKEEFRGKGVAKALVEFGLDYLKGKGLMEVILLVKEGNHAAKKVYSGLGFELVGMHPKQIDGEWIEEMYLSIVDEKPKGVG